MSVCQHWSHKHPYTGQQDRCASCNLPVLFDGSKWVWERALDFEKRNKLIRMFNVDRITGVHA